MLPTISGPVESEHIAVVSDENPQAPTILVVDDERSMRIMIRYALQRDGYALYEATDGEEALTLFTQVKPDLVLMDAAMPRMDGFTACERLRILPGGTETPVLMITGLDDDRSVDRAFEIGVKDFIPKPIHWAVLRQRIHRILAACKTEQDMQRLAYHDALTGLPNRSLLMDRFGAALVRARRGGRRLALLFLDLDHFKLVNDTRGHAIGDALLRAVADRLVESVRESDTVARMGGDEFAVILEEVSAPEQISQIAEKILVSLSKPLCMEGRDLVVSTSMGIALFPDDGMDIGALLRNADIATYRAKEKGRNGYQFYTDEMGSAATRRLLLEGSLRHALRQGQFAMYYQPRVELGSGDLLGFEVLLRWDHPDMGLVYPAEFIRLAEETGLIVPVGQLVLRSACEQCKRWQEEIGNDTLTVSVNISSQELKQQDFAESICAILTELEFSPHCLELELTESMAMDRGVHVTDNLYRLQKLGLQLVIDDFGMGYSSLNNLKQFPIHGLKVDRSFVQGVPEQCDDVAIGQSLGHTDQWNGFAVDCSRGGAGRASAFFA